MLGISVKEENNQNVIRWQLSKVNIPIDDVVDVSRTVHMMGRT